MASVRVPMGRGRAIKREYATTLGELLMHRHGLVETY